MVKALHPAQATWSRPTPDRDADFVKPSYVPLQTPIYEPRREEQTIYAPIPEFKPSELPGKPGELPSGPKMPERRPDPIPAGNPKEKPSEGTPERREAPPTKESEAPKK